jgi:uncharacterized cupin superfamily protein
MADHTELGAAEAADRLALRELFDRYAHCADRRDAAGQKAIFTDDTASPSTWTATGSEPTYVLQGREALTRTNQASVRLLRTDRGCRVQRPLPRKRRGSGRFHVTEA